MLGKLAIKVQYQGQEEELLLIVVTGDRHSLLGRYWLAKLKVDWENILHMHAQETLEDVLDQHEAVFHPWIAKIKGVQATFH